MDEDGIDCVGRNCAGNHGDGMNGWSGIAHARYARCLICMFASLQLSSVLVLCIRFLPRALAPCSVPRASLPRTFAVMA